MHRLQLELDMIKKNDGSGQLVNEMKSKIQKLLDEKQALIEQIDV